jgi:sulfur-oxidizing protein SoxB
VSLSKREFVQLLAAASTAGMALGRWAHADAARAGDALYDVQPAFKGPGAVSLLHFTDCHAQLKPMRFREPSVNLGVGDMRGRWPHRVGAQLLRAASIAPGSLQAHALTHLDFAAASRRYGKVGGFAHLATLIKRLRAGRPGALLLDGGDTWQGSATSLWTQADDMVQAQLALGVDVTTGHWEFTYGMERLKQIVDGDFKGRIAFVAQNVKTADFGDPVFEPFVMREVNRVPVAVIGQAFPYTPIANPRYWVADWTFGIQDDHLQGIVEQVRRAKGAQVVVVLSHNGMDVDLKMASRVRGIDVIFGGHTHDAVPVAVSVANAGGTTLVTNAGCNGKFVGVMDLRVSARRVVDARYRLLPVFSELLPPDAAMDMLITKLRAPYEARLSETLAVTDGLLYRRGNFNGSFDEIVLDALQKQSDAEVAFSPGFRWGVTIVPGQVITLEDVYAHTGITYPNTLTRELTGVEIHRIMEDVADNLFHPDPYYRQGGDMVRLGGLSYVIEPRQGMGRRISEIKVGGMPLAGDRRYKTVSWATPGPEAPGPAAFDVVAAHLRGLGRVRIDPRPRVRVVQ